MNCGSRTRSTLNVKTQRQRSPSDWVVEAQHDLFPAYRGSDYDEWASTAITHITG